MNFIFARLKSRTRWEVVMMAAMMKIWTIMAHKAMIRVRVMMIMDSSNHHLLEIRR